MNELITKFKEAGNDADGTLARFSGNEDLFLKFLTKFPEDETFKQIAPAFDNNDFEQALATTHTLKGVSGNLGMTKLYEATSNTVALIRAKEYDKAKESYAEIKSAYEEICDLLK